MVEPGGIEPHATTLQTNRLHHSLPSACLSYLAYRAHSRVREHARCVSGRRNTSRRLRRVCSRCRCRASKAGYDVLSRLNLKVDHTTGTTQFLSSGGQIIAEYSNTNALLRRFVPGDSVDQPLIWYEGAGTASSGARWFLPNAFGSVIAIGTTGASNTTLGINSYDVFGVGSPSNIGRFQYKGMAYIPEVGLHYARARMYSQGLGRFMQPDPAGYMDGLHLYSFAHNSPVNMLDPLGLAGCDLNWNEVTQSYDDCVVTSTPPDNPPPSPPPPFDPGPPTSGESPGSSGGGGGGSAQDQLDEITVKAKREKDCGGSSGGVAVTGLGLFAAGQAIPGSKPFVTPGSSTGTSLAGLAFSQLPNIRLSTPLPTLVGGLGTGRALRISYTASLNRFASRWLPWVGAAMVVSDLASGGSGGSDSCTNSNQFAGAAEASLAAAQAEVFEL